MLALFQTLFAPKAAAHLRMAGRIFDFGFHLEAQNIVRQLGLTGWMRILQESAIDIEVEGSKPKIEQLIDRLRARGLVARMHGLEVSWKPYTGAFPDFRIRG